MTMTVTDDDEDDVVDDDDDNDDNNDDNNTDNDIKNNAWVTVSNEWGDLPMIFTSDEVTSENQWQITSRVTKNRY